MATKYTIAVAGSTKRTTLCMESLLQDDRFELSWVLTPEPKPKGRQQLVTPNPVHQFAEKHQIPSVLIQKKIDEQVQAQIQEQSKPDFLLIVDFGYIVPAWLLKYVRIFPLNIHPSALPKWRGSSPGQFALLYGDKQSAVSLMVPNDQLDQGPIVTQLMFDVLPNWNQADYYKFAFALITKQLPDLINQLAQDKLSPQAQPIESPTITARQLKRSDGFVSWHVLSRVIKGEKVNCASLQTDQMADLLIQARPAHSSCAVMLEHACRALYPWPGLWTKIPTQRGEKRMKILSCHVSYEKPLQLILDEIQIEGKSPSTWADSKNIIIQ